MTDMHRETWSNDHRGASELLQSIRDALQRREAERGGGATPAEADQQVRAAVEAARDAGVEWSKIADVLGVRRGNAYQRYRRRPRPSDGA
ncbi:MAG: hypothetical protein JWR11_1630 [Mycobacterium sp.]|jgi:hypothetical protein|nr:hypothetical protein [Mycobacterium sp.]MDT5181145.1 hypothetical protein [Mycobacterium sp.]